MTPPPRGQDSQVENLCFRALSQQNRKPLEGSHLCDSHFLSNWTFISPCFFIFQTSKHKLEDVSNPRWSWESGIVTPHALPTLQFPEIRKIRTRGLWKHREVLLLKLPILSPLSSIATILSVIALLPLQVPAGGALSLPEGVLPPPAHSVLP